MKLQFTERFAKEYERLPRPLQGRVDKTLELLIEKPRHPSLHINRAPPEAISGQPAFARLSRAVSCQGLDLSV